MMLTVKYFGLLAEITNSQEEKIEFSGNSLSDLIDVLENRYPSLIEKDFQIAQNKEIVDKQTTISGEEIALLPPFSGG